MSVFIRSLIGIYIGNIGRNIVVRVFERLGRC